jgi:uncharacterized repeat protein (TIGR03803 family)
MRTRAINRLALSIGIAALLAGCGTSQPPIGRPAAMSRESALVARADGANYKVVYRFGKAGDGSFPRANLIDVGGTLYGTTNAGGSGSCKVYGERGCGTIYSITMRGTEKVVYRFSGSPDGFDPFAGLINVGGTLYGTTRDGGSNDRGTVFSVTPTGAEKVLYSFGDNTPDGSNPIAGLTDVKGVLYGTTYRGGSRDHGSVFRVTMSGTEKVLDDFGGNRGSYPAAGLVKMGDELYGATSASCRLGGEISGGAFFRITPSGKAKVLSCFGLRAARPEASLISVDGTFYGTSVRGGTNDECTTVGPDGCGTVFSMTPSGTLQVLHSFGSGTDGRLPQAPLIDVKGTLYGTTWAGGAGGEGTLFSIAPTGAETVLHSFTGGSDGAFPVAGLTDVDGTLYGTTVEGGGSKCHGNSGCGTIFALIP